MTELDQVFQMAEESEHPTSLSFGQFVNIGLAILEGPETVSDWNRLEYRLILEALRKGKKVIFSFRHKTIGE